jgi:hypothetical protein
VLRTTHSFKRLGDISRNRGRRYTAKSGQLGFGPNILAERLPLPVQSAYGSHARCDRSSNAIIHPGAGVAHQSAPDGPGGSTCGRIHCEAYRAIDEPACARPGALTLANARGTSEAKRVRARQRPRGATYATAHQSAALSLRTKSKPPRPYGEQRAREKPRREPGLICVPLEACGTEERIRTCSSDQP